MQPKLKTALYLLSGFIFLAFLTYRILLIFSYQPDIGGIENSVVYFIQRLLDGQPLYTHPEAAPYSITQYGPLYYQLVRFNCTLTSTSPDDVMGVFVINRSTGLALNLFYLLIVYRLCRKVFSLGPTRSWLVCLASFIFLELPSFARPDSLYLPLFFAGLYLFYRGIMVKNRTTAYLLASAAFGTLAFFTKQSALLLPLITGFWLLSRRQFRTLSYYSGAYLLFTASGIGILSLQTDLGIVYVNLVQGVNNGISITWFWDHILHDFFASFGALWVLLAIPVVQLLAPAVKKEDFSKQALVSLFLLSVLLSLKWGSWLNYFTEWLTILFVLLAYTWNRMELALEQIAKGFASLAVTTLFGVKLLLLTYPLHPLFKAVKSRERTLYDQELLVAERIRSTVPAGTPVFNNLMNPESFLNNLLFRQVVVPQFEIVYFTTYDRGVFDYSGLHMDLRQGRIPVIITKGKNALQFRNLPLEGYQFVEKIDRYEIFRLGNGLK